MIGPMRVHRPRRAVRCGTAARPAASTPASTSTSTTGTATCGSATRSPSTSTTSRIGNVGVPHRRHPLVLAVDDPRRLSTSRCSPAVAQEFVCGSVSSRGCRLTRATWPWAMGDARCASLPPGFRYVDLVRRGFGLVECTPTSSSVESGWWTRGPRRLGPAGLPVRLGRRHTGRGVHPGPSCSSRDIRGWRAARCHEFAGGGATGTWLPSADRIRSEQGQHVVGGGLAGADRALHVAVPHRRALGAGPVDPPDRRRAAPWPYAVHTPGVKWAP